MRTLTITRSMLVLAAIDHRQLQAVVDQLPRGPRHGRPWSCSLRQRVLVACAALRTNLTIRELAATFGLSKSAVHRIVAALTPRLAALATSDQPLACRESWVVDGTLVPTRDHRRAARSKTTGGRATPRS